jgi:hypothetical protein
MASTQEMKQRMQDAFADREHAFDQFDKLLSVAETLQDKCEARERKLHLTFSLFSLLILTSGLVLAVLSSIPELQGPSVSVSSNLFGIGSVLIVVAYIAPLCFRDRKRQSRDRQTIHSIVDMLREVETAFALQMHFSAIEEENFKVRLRRFEIGPSADSVEKRR